MKCILISTTKTASEVVCIAGYTEVNIETAGELVASQDILELIFVIIGDVVCTVYADVKIHNSKYHSALCRNVIEN